MAAVPLPSFVVVTVPVLFDLEPLVVAVTSTLTEHDNPGVAIEPPLRLTEVAEATGVKVPPQVLPELGIAATCMPAGKVSVKAMPFIAPVSAAGSVMVMVIVEVPLSAMVDGAKTLVVVGG